MSVQLIKGVDFGVRKTGLSTVGYTLYNTDGTAKQARTTSGVSETKSGSGSYRCLIIFDDGWNGIILWDTGEASPLYAQEFFNYLQYGGGGGGLSIQGEFLSKEEKDKVLKSLSDIFAEIEKLKKKVESYDDVFNSLSGDINKLGLGIKGVKEAQRFEDIIKDINLLNGLLKKNETLGIIVIKEVGKHLTKIVTSLVALKEDTKLSDEVKSELDKLKEAITAINKDIAITIKIGSKLLPTKDLEELLKEGGLNVPRIAIK